MTSYFQYNERRTRKPPKRTEHGTEIVDIPDVMVTEALAPTTRLSLEEFEKVLDAAARKREGALDDAIHNWDPLVRHDWIGCPCVMCRIDRGEDE